MSGWCFEGFDVECDFFFVFDDVFVFWDLNIFLTFDVFFFCLIFFSIKFLCEFD